MTRPAALRRLEMGLAARRVSPTVPRRRRRMLAGLTATVILAGACSVPEDSRPRALDYSRLPDDLVAGTEPPEPTPLVTQEVLIYLIDENSLLSAAARDVASPASPISVLEALFSAPNEAESALALSTALPADAEVISVDVDPPNNLVTVALESEVFEERLEGENRQLAVAQLVFTATEATGTSRFSLLLNGNPVPLPTDNGESEVPVTRDGFWSVDPSYQPEPAPSETPAPTEPPTPTAPPETPTPTATPTVAATPTPEPGPTLPPGLPPDFTLDFS